MTAANQGSDNPRSTYAVPEELFRQVYDSPHALPGKERWVTSDEDVRRIEYLLGMEERTIGAPLWVSGDTRRCPKCGRETSWLDIVASALRSVHDPRLIARVILGERKFVNTEAPRAIADLHCFDCGAEITDLRSFKCHNWAYAMPQMEEVLARITRQEGA
jgi:hypothetical protein